MPKGPWVSVESFAGGTAPDQPERVTLLLEYGGKEARIELPVESIRLSQERGIAGIEGYRLTLLDLVIAGLEEWERSDGQIASHRRRKT